MAVCPARALGAAQAQACARPRAARAPPRAAAAPAAAAGTSALPAAAAPLLLHVARPPAQPTRQPAASQPRTARTRAPYAMNRALARRTPSAGLRRAAGPRVRQTGAPPQTQWQQARGAAEKAGRARPPGLMQPRDTSPHPRRAPLGETVSFRRHDRREADPYLSWGPPRSVLPHPSIPPPARCDRRLHIHDPSCIRRGRGRRRSGARGAGAGNSQPARAQGPQAQNLKLRLCTTPRKGSPRAATRPIAAALQ